MKGYVYIMYKGADPSKGWEMTDPIFKGVPTMGACRPDIRRLVEKGDYIFPISGRIVNVQQHIVGAMEVDKKIDAMAALKRFPKNQQSKNQDGKYSGNIIIDDNGLHLPEDYHTNFENRLENYIVGNKGNSLFFDKKREMEKAKEESLEVLNSIFGKNEDQIYKVIGRWRKMDHSQINDLLSWMNKIKGNN